MEISRVEALSERVVQTYTWGEAVWHVWHRSTNVAESSIKAPDNANDADALTKPLVLLHGGSGSWTHWLRNVEHLSQFRTVWALDIPGFGDSSLPAGVSDAGISNVAATILTLLGQSVPGDYRPALVTVS
jgi:pimeloyl-ACP methyl ester carboxylesterase